MAGMYTGRSAAHNYTLSRSRLPAGCTHTIAIIHGPHEFCANDARTLYKKHRGEKYSSNLLLRTALPLTLQSRTMTHMKKKHFIPNFLNI